MPYLHLPQTGTQKSHRLRSEISGTILSLSEGREGKEKVFAAVKKTKQKVTLKETNHRRALESKAYLKEGFVESIRHIQVCTAFCNYA